VSPTTQAEQMTLTLVRPCLAVEGLALLVIALCVLILRWRQGRLGAALFGLGLMPLALVRLLVGLRDALWFVSGRQGAPEWLGDVIAVLLKVDLVMPGLVLSAAVAASWVLRQRRAGPGQPSNG
jgi:hypothetical protein